jgi:hypothetical protein
MNEDNPHIFGLQDNVIAAFESIRTRRCKRCHRMKSLLRFYVQHIEDGSESWYDWCQECERKNDGPGLLADALSRALEVTTITTANKKIESETGRHIRSVHIDDLQRLWDEQNGYCAYWTHKSLSTRLPGPFQISVVRKDTDLGFERNNMILVCHEFNTPRYWTDDKIDELKSEYLQRRNDTINLSWLSTLRNSGCFPFDYVHTRGKKCVQPYHEQIDFFKKIIKRNIAADAEKRMLVPTITLPELVDIYEYQQGKCHITGKRMSLGSNRQWMLSCKRKDLGRGFSVDNINLQCFEFNPGHWSPEMYRQWMACSTDTCNHQQDVKKEEEEEEEKNRPSPLPPMARRRGTKERGS